MISVSSHGMVVMNEHAKELLFRIDCELGALAYSSDGKTRPLSECNIHDVKFTAGAWCIQNKLNRKTQRIRMWNFVLGEKINCPDNDSFEFYHARMVRHNQYGPYLVDGLDIVVAKFEFNGKTYWGYGRNIEHARTVMIVGMYSKCMPLIYSAAHQNKIRVK